VHILVTGGAGYIGSHVVKRLITDTQHHITSIDNFSTGFRSAHETLNKIFKDYSANDRKCSFKEIDLSDRDSVDRLFAESSFDAVIHFAAFSQVGESMEKPSLYYMNNTANTSNLVHCCVKYSVNKFIFSSTASVYGDPVLTGGQPKITEDFPTNPISVYGSSKLFSEKIIQDTGKSSSDFKYIILRYFNVAGADPENRLGENHNPETHLIPLIAGTALGRREKLYIFGDDYDTPDGTCIRDYIHVEDLAAAHIAALYHLEKGESDIFNCGYGRGFSVREVTDKMKDVSGCDFCVETKERRSGDPAQLVADSSKMLRLTNWKPEYDNLYIICKTALEWEKQK